MNNRSGNVVISIEVTVTLRDHKTFNTHIQSKWFLVKYILTKPFIGETRLSQFQSWQVDTKLVDCIDNITMVINNTCLFCLIGW